MQILPAANADIPLLVTLRLDFLGAMRTLSSVEKERLSVTLHQYYTQHMLRGDFVALLAWENGKVVSCVYAVFHDYPPTDLAPLPRRAYISNVFTYPAFRRRGYAAQLLQELIALCKQNGACEARLEATPEGRPLYESLGFAPTKSIMMRLPISFSQQESAP